MRRRLLSIGGSRFTISRRKSEYERRNSTRFSGDVVRYIDDNGSLRNGNPIRVITMTQTFHGRIKMVDGYFSDTRIMVVDTGWVHVSETGRWYPPSRVQYIDPDDNPPEEE